MNIFYLHPDTDVCATMHCDKHAVKMILEYAQLLSTAHHVLDGEPEVACYKKTHVNHPSAVWSRENTSNYRWLWSLLDNLCKEYTVRYQRVHKTESSGIVAGLRILPKNITEGAFTQPPQCMPDYCKDDTDAIIGYRNYYIKEKSYMAKWKNTKIPAWYQGGMQQ